MSQTGQQSVTDGQGGRECVTETASQTDRQCVTDRWTERASQTEKIGKQNKVEKMQTTVTASKIGVNEEKNRQ